MPEEPVLRTEELTKRFGRILAVNKLNLEVYPGQVFGLLGPNGSGKTTTLGMLLGVVSKTSGSYSWFGQGEGYGLRKRIGAILEQPAFYPFISGLQNLKVIAEIKEVSNPNYDELIELVNLKGRERDNFKTYSLGMKQRLAIAGALIADPDILIFDEPTNGLDPQGIAEIRTIIRRISNMGKTIVLASHLLDEVQKVCTYFAVLRRGQLIHTGSVEEVLRQNNQIEISADELPPLRWALQDMNWYSEMREEEGKLLLTVRDGVSPAEVNRLMMDKGITLSHLTERRSNLEEQFLNILRENG